MAGPGRLSKMMGLQLTDNIKGDVRSKSQKLFAELGLIKLDKGLPTLSPIIVKSLRKLENLVRVQMEAISASEIRLPSLTDTKLLEKSGRSDLPDLFKTEKTEDGKHFYLNPTCEEGITELLAMNNHLTYKQLPCRLYQISNKFRDEKRCRSGLLRSREFLMKDLYCFDADPESSLISYSEIKKRYNQLFTLLNVPYVCVKGSPGTIGGLESNEFHFLSDAGDDDLILCLECGHKETLDTRDDDDANHLCPNCQSKNFKILKGIEVGHTFNLGTRYTKPFSATYKDHNGKQQLLHMSCFGLGLTRIIAASVELLATPSQIRWPLQIAPYLLCIIPPKAGSIEEKAMAHLTDTLIHNLHTYLREEMIVDDRTSYTIGKRLSSVKVLGIPYAVVIGKGIRKDQPVVEVYDINENTMDEVPISDVMQCLRNKLLGKSADPSLLLEKQRL